MDLNPYNSKATQWSSEPTTIYTLNFGKCFEEKNISQLTYTLDVYLTNNILLSILRKHPMLNVNFYSYKTKHILEHT